MSINRQPYLDNIMNRFKGNVVVAKGSLENEIYIPTNKENLDDVCTYIHKTFQSPLSSIICNDERSLNKNFTIYYVFSLPDKDLFFIVFIPVSEQQPDFQVIRDLGGDDFLLLCWEAPGQFCHRRVVAAWLEKELGLKVEEFNPKLRRHQAWLRTMEEKKGDHSQR